MSERKEGKRLFDILRDGDVLVVRWVDRLGRNYQDVTDTIRTLMRQGVIIKTVINKLTFDGSTTDPMEQAIRDAMIGFMAASAQAQTEVQKEAQQAGIKSAKSDRKKYRGKKPSYTRDDFNTVVELASLGTSITSTSKILGLTRQTVMRIRSEPLHAVAVLAKWGL